MPRPSNMTLGEMRRKMALRLGYGSQGAASITLKDPFNEYLQNAQEMLYEFFADMLLEDFVDDLEVDEGQTLYDVDDLADPQRLADMNIQIGGYWYPMKKGIMMHDRDHDPQQPRKWMVKYGTTNEAQIEISPTPDKKYTLGYTYTRRLSRFTQDEDTCTLHGRMVLTLALADAAAHYGRGNADRLTAQGQALMGQMRARKNKGVVVRRGTPHNPHIPGVTDFNDKINQISYERNMLIGEVSGFLVPE